MSSSGYHPIRMRQGELFSCPEPSARAPIFERIEMEDAEVSLCQRFLTPDVARQVYEQLRVAVDWQQESYVMYGRETSAPRLTAWYGDPASVYEYSGLRHEPTPWGRMPMLSELRESIQIATAAQFNSVLLNYYRDGCDGVAWHSDDEADLGTRPTIASLSLGVPRVFQFKHRDRTELERIDVELQPGSLLLMAGDCQRCWRHQIPKRKNVRDGRINLTFRMCREI